MPTIAETAVHNLATNGIQGIWGVPGDSLNAVPEGIRREKGIEWMRSRHEEEAAFAAAGEAALTGELAVCAGSCGPGNMHLINGLCDAHRSRVPVLAIASHIPRDRDRQPALPGNPAHRTVPRLRSPLRNGPQR